MPDSRAGSFFGEVLVTRFAPGKKPMPVVFRVPWSVSLRNTQYATRNTPSEAFDVFV